MSSHYNMRMLTFTTFTVLLFITVAVRCNRAPSVIIVGAGAAGIAAAAKLLENNITNITILEAEKRIGGRIHSVKFGDAVVDLGAEWCHGEKNNVVYEMVEGLDLLAHSPSLNMNVYRSSHKSVDRTLQKEIAGLFLSIYEEKSDNESTLGQYMLRRYNESILEKYSNDLEKLEFAVECTDTLMKWLLSIEGSFSWFDLSAASDYVECEGDHALNWRGRGYKTILEVLMKKYPEPAEELPVMEKTILNKEVVWIDWNNNSTSLATLKCMDGSVFAADHVIITPSLGVLKDRYQILFHPLLPEDKINAIKELGIGAVGKIFFHFSERWWPTDNFTDFTFVWSEKDRQSALQEFPSGPNEDGKSWITDLMGFYAVAENPGVLAAWFCGKFVPQIELCPDDVITDGAVFALNKFLGHHFENMTRPDAIARYKWYTNPHFRGTYSFETVQSRSRGRSENVVLSQPLTSGDGKQTLLFAGEATHPIYYSTVHGAIETGQREADRIISLYK